MNDNDSTPEFDSPETAGEQNELSYTTLFALDKLASLAIKASLRAAWSGHSDEEVSYRKMLAKQLRSRVDSLIMEEAEGSLVWLRESEAHEDEGSD